LTGFAFFKGSFEVPKTPREGVVKRQKHFLSMGEIAQYCAVSQLIVTNWIRAGELFTSHTPGRDKRIRREDLLSFLIEHGFPVRQELAVECKQILAIADDGPWQRS
jgi:excisionase family DNA binding protein